MSFNTRIKERREQLHLTRSELADKIGVTQSAISNYENAISSPKIELLYKLFDALKCDANYLYQDEMQVLTYANTATPDEFEKLVKPYRALDQHGQQTVNIILDRETERVSKLTELQSLTENQASHIVSLERATRPAYYISYYQRMASAGSGEYLFDDLPTDVIEVLDSPIARQADFVLGVNGRSMEPTYYDGDRVFVQKTDEIPNGCIGVFTRGNDCYIKELGADRLISHNPDKKTFPDIIVDDREVKLVGRVLGKVE